MLEKGATRKRLLVGEAARYLYYPGFFIFLVQKHSCPEQVLKSRMNMGIPITINEAMANRIFAMPDSLKIVVYGANDVARDISRYFNRNNRKISYFIDERPKSDTFEDRPLRSAYDLVFEDVSDKLIIPVAPLFWSKAGDILYDLGFMSRVVELCRYKGHLTADAQLGHNRTAGELPGFKFFGNYKVPNARLVVTLGGSTSDAFIAEELDDEYYVSWPCRLYERLRQVDPTIVLAAGGIAGHAATHELHKLIRDVLPLNPELVISYSGINDMQYAHVVENAGDLFGNRYERPYLHASSEIFYRVAFPMAREILGKSPSFLINTETPKDGGKVSFGVRNNMGVARHWVNCMRMMKCLCDEFSCRFLSAFQPYHCTYHGKKFGAQKAFFYSSKGFSESRLEFQRRAVDKTRELVRDNSYIMDYSAMFDDAEAFPFGLDFMHANPLGNQTIAENIMSDIIRLGLLR